MQVNFKYHHINQLNISLAWKIEFKKKHSET